MLGKGIISTLEENVLVYLLYMLVYFSLLEKMTNEKNPLKIVLTL